MAKFQKSETAAEESQPQDEQPQDGDQKVALTFNQISELVDRATKQAVQQALASLPQTTAGKPPHQRMTNRDLQLQNMGRGRQTQEDVAALAISMGPSTHQPGFLPFPPEDVVAKDMSEHQQIIDQLEGMGYVVFLNRLEFHARWEPTKMEYRGDRQVKVRVFDQEETNEGFALVDKLMNLEPRFSRIWLQAWVNRKPITGDRQLDDLAAEDTHQGLIARQRDLELTRVETGSFDHLDNLKVPV